MTHAEKAIRNEQMRKYKETHTVPETAEHFGVCEGTVTLICKGIAPQTDRRPKTYRNKYSDEGDSRIIKTIEERAPGFMFVGDYTGSDGFVKIRCKTCGTVSTKSCISIRHGKARCKACYEKEIRLKQEKARAEKEETRKQKRKQKAAAIAWSRYEKSIKQQTFAICKECSTLFIQTARKETYCSDECRRRANNNHKDRRLKGVSQDTSITLRKVYEKAAGVCYLCGGMCDWDDIETREDGTMVAGNRYPSIDHVYPISLGGTHTWDNVRLAHRWCNTVKSDNPLSQKPAI